MMMEAMDASSLTSRLGEAVSPCNYFTFKQGTCWMKATNSNRVKDNQATSGGCHAKPTPAGDDCIGDICVYWADGKDTKAAADLAAKSDVAMVFLATSSSEGGDRGSLSLDGNGDDLVPAVAAANPKTAVLTSVPGAILTPWRDAVAAITTAFMPGQEYGHALADVAFGDVAPSAKLPLTFPTKENEVGFTPEEYPGTGSPKVAKYDEKMAVGYRW